MKGQLAADPGVPEWAERAARRMIREELVLADDTFGDASAEVALTIAEEFVKSPDARKLEKGQALADLAEAAWGVIANASGGDWTRESQDWQDAAATWRDRWHLFIANPAALSAWDASRPKVEVEGCACHDGCAEAAEQRLKEAREAEGKLINALRLYHNRDEYCGCSRKRSCPAGRLLEGDAPNGSSE